MYRIPMRDSLLALEKRPWIFFVELIRYLIFGTGMLLAPVLQLAIFSSSRFLDATGAPSKTNLAKKDSLPDIEIMPVSTFTILRHEVTRVSVLRTQIDVSFAVYRCLMLAMMDLSTSRVASTAF